MQVALLVTVMMAAAMVVGDGVLTPSISGVLLLLSLPQSADACMHHTTSCNACLTPPPTSSRPDCCTHTIVLSAISGIKVAVPALQQVEIIGLTIAVLILLFSVQYLGTSRISGVFAPVVAIWLLFNCGIGLYNLSTCGWGVWQVCVCVRACVRALAMQSEEWPRSTECALLTRTTVACAAAAGHRPPPRNLSLHGTGWLCGWLEAARWRDAGRDGR
jgi:hypothetical protein